MRIKGKNCVSVLICTYNGQDYVQGLLVSILDSNSDVFIIVSDDGSSDLTLEKCKEVFFQYGFEDYKIVVNSNRGVKRNFIEALKYNRSEYIFICDQDDLWISGRIALYRKFFTHSNVPHLIFSDASVVNEVGDELETSFIKSERLKVDVLRDDSILISNCVQGATCCLNIALVKKIAEIVELHSINDIVIHDWFVAIVAKYFGRIDFIEQPTIKYRQHESNVIGAKNKASYSKLIDFILSPKSLFLRINEASRQYLLMRSVLRDNYTGSFNYAPFAKTILVLFFSLFYLRK